LRLLRAHRVNNPHGRGVVAGFGRER
jgi:hypothetical protein